MIYSVGIKLCFKRNAASICNLAVALAVGVVFVEPAAAIKLDSRQVGVNIEPSSAFSSLRIAAQVKSPDFYLSNSYCHIQCRRLLL